MLAMLSGCRPAASTEHYTPPDKVLAFEKLFEQNCEGCHGRDGHLGPAPVLNDSLFVHVISDDQLRQVISDGRRVSGAGRRGTLMPAHAKERGGKLTSKQIDILITGIRKRWGATPISGPLPRYAAATTTSAAASDAQAGQKLFETVCARCHGKDGRGDSDFDVARRHQ